MKRKIFFSYLAGVIDSDGHICWRSGRYNAPDIGITNTSHKFMRFIKNNLGGSVCIQRSAGSMSLGIHRKDVLKWHCTGYRAVIILDEIKNFLVIKRKKAIVCIARYHSFSKKMKRQKRRIHHMNKEKKFMASRGWD